MSRTYAPLVLETETELRIAYFDPISGIAGDMLLAALVDAGADAASIQSQLRSMGLPALELKFSPTNRCGFRSLRLDVLHPAEHVHRGLSHIRQMIDAGSLSPRAKQLATRIFAKLAEAEAKVHGTTVEHVHFHEVGAVDSIADIVGIAIALDQLNIDKIASSHPALGSGTVTIAHGLVGIPAPATAELLRGIPIRESRIQAELTTPTGAAVLAALCDAFGPIPAMQPERIGYGAGHKDFPDQANMLRIIIGTAPEESTQDEVVLLETNIDDISAEQLGFTIEQLWRAQVLDVTTTAVGMKKNRPGTLLSVLCRPDAAREIERVLFENTGSLGIRRSNMQRSKLRREIVRVDTQFGTLRESSLAAGWFASRRPRV
ncbi:MAG: nickel pincer cofactor biosynthesis protein LarC [Pirellulales bacterium]